MKKYLVKVRGNHASYVSVSKDVSRSPKKLKSLRSSSTFRGYKLVEASSSRAAINKVIKPHRLGRRKR